MRKTLLVALFLATSAAMPAYAVGEMAGKITKDSYSELETTISQYFESTTVDTETFEDGAVVNITPLIDQVNAAFANRPYTSEDRDASNKKLPAYVTQDQFDQLTKAVESQLAGFAGGDRVNVGLARQAVTTTLSQAQTSTQIKNIAQVSASERAAIKAYVAAMKASGQTLKMTAGGAIAWGATHGYPVVKPVYYSKSELDARFVGSAKTATSGGATGSSNTGTATSGNTGAGTSGNTGTSGTSGSGTATGSSGTGSTGTGSTASGSTGTGTAGTGTGTTGMGGTVGLGSGGTTGMGGTVGLGSGGTGMTGTGSTGTGGTATGSTDLGTAIGQTGGGTATSGTSSGGSTGAPVTTGMSSNGTSSNTADGAVAGGLTTDPSKGINGGTVTNPGTVFNPPPTTPVQNNVDPTLNTDVLTADQGLSPGQVPTNTGGSANTTIGQSVGSALSAAARAME